MQDTILIIKDIIQNRYGSAEGKACRKEFWTFALFSYISIAIGFIINYIPVVGPVFSAIVVMGLFIPYITTSMRRLNDLGFNKFLALLPFALVALGLSALAFASIYNDPVLKAAYPIMIYAAGGLFALLHILFLKKGTL